MQGHVEIVRALLQARADATISNEVQLLFHIIYYVYHGRMYKNWLIPQQFVKCNKLLKRKLDIHSSGFRTMSLILL